MSSFALQCEKEECEASTVFIVALVASIFSYCGAVPPQFPAGHSHSQDHFRKLAI